MFGRRRGYVSLAIESGVLRYLELSPSSQGFKVSRSAKAALDDGVVVQDRIVDMEGLSSAIGALKTKLGGRFASTMVVGLPPQDAIVRIVEMPRMSMEDARSAFGWDFENYFSFPLKDATYDLAPVEVPSPLSEESMTVLVVASRLTVVSGILNIMDKEGVRVSAIEPDTIALVRAVSGRTGEESSGRLILSVGAKSSQIIVEYKGNGLVYRTVYVGARSELQGGTGAYEMLVREVSSSLVYAGSQFRGLNVKEILLCGEYGNHEDLKAEAQLAFDTYECRAADPWREWSISGDLSEYGWEAAIGLAVRDRS